MIPREFSGAGKGHGRDGKRLNGIPEILSVPERATLGYGILKEEPLK